MFEGNVEDETVTLTIREPLPSMKEFTSAMKDHWLELIHTAISTARREHSVPYFEKAFVWIAVALGSASMLGVGGQHDGGIRAFRP